MCRGLRQKAFVQV